MCGDCATFGQMAPPCRRLGTPPRPPRKLPVSMFRSKCVDFPCGPPARGGPPIAMTRLPDSAVAQALCPRAASLCLLGLLPGSQWRHILPEQPRAHLAVWGSRVPRCRELQRLAWSRSNAAWQLILRRQLPWYCPLHRHRQVGKAAAAHRVESVAAAPMHRAQSAPHMVLVGHVGWFDRVREWPTKSRHRPARPQRDAPTLVSVRLASKSFAPLCPRRAIGRQTQAYVGPGQPGLN